MHACCRRASRNTSLFGLLSAPNVGSKALAELQHFCVPVRYRQPKPGPTTRKVLLLENTATWRHNDVDEDAKRRRQQFDIVACKSTGQLARALVDAVLPLPDVKEEIYTACDAWSAWELDFPLVAAKRALCKLRDMREWHRIIQVSKWLLSKGHGFTMGTYDLLIRALNADGRLEEAEEVWYTLVLKREESIPKMMYARMIWIYEKRGMPDKALKMFRDMERQQVRPDMGTLKRVGNIYEQLGFTNKLAELMEKHKELPRPLAYKFFKRHSNRKEASSNTDKMATWQKLRINRNPGREL